MKYLNRNLILTIVVSLFIAGCGGSSSGGDGGNQSPETVTVSGEAVQSAGGTNSIGDQLTSSTITAVPDNDFIDACVDEYATLWSDLEPDRRVQGDQLNITRTINGTDFIAENVDTDEDSIADVNIIADVPDMDFIDHINFDVDCDGRPDVNIDTTGNGLPNKNIDENKDGEGDYNIGSGTVTTVPGAAVRIVELPEQANSRAFEATSNSNGRFAIEDVETGEYNVEVEKENSGVNAWNRGVVNITTNNTDVGQLPLDTGPYLENATSVSINSVTNKVNLDIDYDSRSTSNTVSDAFSIGDSFEWTVAIIDPNEDQIDLKIPRYDANGDGWYNEFISGNQTTNDDETVSEFNITVTLRDSYYEMTVNGVTYNYVPRYLKNSSANHLFNCTPTYILEECSDQPSFTWNEVEDFNINHSFNNDDGLNTGNEFNDISTTTTLQNESYNYEVFDEDINVSGVTINGSFYQNNNTLEDFTVDLGDVTNLGTIDVNMSIESHSTYDTEVFWVTPSGAERDDNTYTENVSDIPSTYEPVRFEGIAYFINENGNKSDATTSVNITYDVAGDAEPSVCNDLIINGDTENNNPIFFPGDTITIEADVSDPKGLQTEYAVSIPNDTLTDGYISTNESISYTFKEADVSDEFRFVMKCRNNDGFGVFGSNSRDDIYTELVNVSQ